MPQERDPTPGHPAKRRCGSLRSQPQIPELLCTVCLIRDRATASFLRAGGPGPPEAPSWQRNVPSDETWETWTAVNGPCLAVDNRRYVIVLRTLLISSRRPASIGNASLAQRNFRPERGLLRMTSPPLQRSFKPSGNFIFQDGAPSTSTTVHGATTQYVYKSVLIFQGSNL